MLVLGLGNPGPRFHGTRHNAGFDVLTRASDLLGTQLTKRLFRPYESGSIDSLLLVRPLTYMNRSGDVLPKLMKRNSLSPSDILVVCDNMDLPPGAVRIKLNGKTRAHNGIGSVMDSLGTGEFPRLYIGVGRPEASDGVVEHVLSVPSEDELADYRLGLDRAAKAVARLKTETVMAIASSLARA